MNTFNDFFRAITDVMAGNRVIFLATGLAIFRLITVLVLMWFGAKTLMLGYFNMREFLPMIGRILLFLMALLYYSTPAPVFGVSLTGLITDEAGALSNTLVGASESETMTFQTLTAIQQALDGSLPLIPGMVELVRYVLVTLILSGLEAVIWAVISLGFVAVAILITIGPLFLAFGILPGLEQLATAWFWALLSFNFYSVIGSCYLLVAARVLSYFLLANQPPYSVAKTWNMFLPAIMICGSLAVGTLLIPALALTLFGAGGQTAVPRWLRWSA